MAPRNVNVTVTAEDIETREELCALFFELTDSGFVGGMTFSVSEAADTAPPEFRIDMHTPDPTSPTGVRQLTARVGDVKVTTGSSITVLTADAYDATYGGN